MLYKELTRTAAEICGNHKCSECEYCNCSAVRCPMLDIIDGRVTDGMTPFDYFDAFEFLTKRKEKNNAVCNGTGSL